MTGDFGPCQYCAEDAIVKVNGIAVCLKHMNDEFKGIGDTVREIIKEVYSDGR